jgi:hypothetical protein
VTQGGYRPRAIDADAAAAGEHSANIALHLVLTIFTLGLFNLYWNYKQMQSCNELLDERRFRWLSWILLSIVTFGIYHFYYQYKMGAALNDIQRAHDLPVTEGLPVLSLVATLIGFGIVTDCIHQHELNRIDAELAADALG